MEIEIALSPDGSLLAFTRVDGDSTDLFVKQIGSGEPLRIAQGLFAYSQLSWSPEGREIAFSRQVEREGEAAHDAIIAVPALGGAERQLTTAVTKTHGLAWSPDGQRLAITDTQSAHEPDGIFLVSLETGEKQRLTGPPREFRWGDWFPRLSPDGRTVAFLRGSGSHDDIFLVSVEGGEPRRLTSGNGLTRGLDWAPDGKSLVFSSTRARAGFAGLWRVPAAGGEPEPLPFGENAAQLTVPRRVHRLAYVKRQEKGDIWRLPGQGAAATVPAPERLLSSTWLDACPEYSPDGRRIAFASTRSGHMEIWVSDAEGTSPRQLTFLEDPWTVAPTWSPDGQQIAFHSGREGSFDIYVIGASGGAPRRITADPWPLDEFQPRWSRDGPFVYFASFREGRADTWKVPAEGGEAVQVTRAGGAVAFESPDGQSLYYTKAYGGGGPPGLWRRPIAGGPEERVLENVFLDQWDICERGIYYFNYANDPDLTIDFYDFSTGRVSLLAQVEIPFVWGFTCSRDCAWVLYASMEVQSDIMVVDGFR
jgi:Tol biopolymer transport system component